MKKHLCMPVTAALTLGMMSLGGAHVFASDTGAPADEHSLGETVVTATRTPLSVRQAPANVAVITAQEIEQNHYRSASEALEHVNGVVVDRASGEEYVRLNGDDRVVVMVDGVRLNNDQGVVNGRAGVDLRMIPSVKDIKRIEVVKGGLILDIGLRGFLPASLVDLRRVKDLGAFMGTRIEARVIEMDRNRNNVVLSRRIVLEEARKAERQDILGKLQVGMKLKGTVSSIVEFGAFVDLGGIDGLVHISELSWNHVNHPSEVVKVGQEVEVQVLDVDLNRERISLGLKQTSEDPWRVLVSKYPVDAIIEGTVTKLVTFGAFVDLGNGVEGLVHISEMAKQHVTAPSQVCKVGDVVQVKVMEIDLDRRRISLSMKAAAETLGIDIEVTPLPEEERAAAEAAAAEAEADLEAHLVNSEANAQATEEAAE